MARRGSIQGGESCGPSRRCRHSLDCPKSSVSRTWLARASASLVGREGRIDGTCGERKAALNTATEARSKSHHSKSQRYEWINNRPPLYLRSSRHNSNALKWGSMMMLGRGAGLDETLLILELRSCSTPKQNSSCCRSLTTSNVNMAHSLRRPWRYPNIIDAGRNMKSTGYRTK